MKNSDEQEWAVNPTNNTAVSLRPFGAPSTTARRPLSAWKIELIRQMILRSALELSLGELFFNMCLLNQDIRSVLCI